MSIALCLCTLAVGGCSNDSTPPTHIKKYVAQVKSQPAKPVEGLPNLKTATVIKQYSATALRNPFKKPLAQTTVENTPDLNRPKEPLEQYPLDSLHMVGNLSKSGTQWAIIAAPDGSVYPVTEGQHMGQHFGKIVKISADKIEIEENIRLGERWKKQPITLSLFE